MGLMRPKNSAYRLAPEAAGTVKKNLPNPATGTSRALLLITSGLLPQLRIAALRTRRYLIPRRIALRIANLGARRAVGDVVHLVLVDAKSADRGRRGAALGRQSSLTRSRLECATLQ